MRSNDKLIIALFMAMVVKSASYQAYCEVVMARKLILPDFYPAWLNLMRNDHKLFEKYVSNGVHPSREAYYAVLLPILHKNLDREAHLKDNRFNPEKPKKN